MPASSGNPGPGRAVPDPRKVFINCPFDEDYSPTLDALIFATVCCGFIPCSALESGTVARSRINRILDGLSGAKYSLHDLSRCRGEGEEGLARFNMPLELGIAMALRHQSAGRNHDWAVLVPEGHLYARFVSDLAGYDLLRYDARPESAIPRMMGWLTTRPDAVAPTVSPRDVREGLPEFDRHRRGLEEDWEGEVPWDRLIEGALTVARQGGLID
jgi:hypothetical protein